MAPPPAKRQKRLIVLSSDEDEGAGGRYQNNGAKREEASVRPEDKVNSSCSLPTRSRTKPRATAPKPRSGASHGSTPSSSPEKPRKKLKAESKSQKAGSLYTFFNAATQSQRVNGRSDSAPLEVDAEEKDFIQDDPLDEELVPVQGRLGKSEGIDGKRTGRRKSSAPNGTAAHNETYPNASQRFLMPTQPAQTGFAKHLSGKTDKEDLRPWWERYAPASLEELAVHKRKVSDVRNWLDDAFHGRSRKRLLVLKGPSGTGKTATISTLAKVMPFEISEWRNPVGQDFSSEGFQSMSTQFEEFLGRSGKFGSLDFEESANTTEAQPLINRDSKSHGFPQKITLLEDFPNTFTRTSSALQSFRASILQYLASNNPPLGTVSVKQHEIHEMFTPLIMIISETLLTTTTPAADSFTVHRLLGHDILNHPGVSVIEFNPIAVTFLSKALDLVIQKEARQSGRRRTPGAAVLKRLGEVGDIRSAIGSLEFLCVRGDIGSDWSGRVASKLRKGTQNASTLTKLEQDSIEMVTQREASLGIFHAVGKVVYNKREDVAAADRSVEPPAQPPDHLSCYARPKISQVSVDQLIDETGTDTQTFVAALHENYIRSCDGPSSIDAVNGCIEALSDSDLLSPNRSGGFASGGTGGGSVRGVYQGAGSDSMRQDELCFQIAVRGILFALPYPVKRQTTQVGHTGHGSGKSDAHKMFYPTSARLWKQTEEIESLVDLWIDCSMRGTGLGGPGDKGHGGSAHASGRVETWRTKSSAASHDTTTDQETNEAGPTPLLLTGNSARREMLLERLPYLAKIQRRNAHPSRMRELEKITQFHGIDVPSDNVPDEEDEREENSALPPATAAAEWTTDPPTDSKPSDIRNRPASQLVSLGSAGERRGFGTALPAVERAVEKLVLSEDDIEDD